MNCTGDRKQSPPARPRELIEWCEPEARPGWMQRSTHVNTRVGLLSFSRRHRRPPASVNLTRASKPMSAPGR